ncbi:hypothetical protein FACS189490_04780 [Clostridia bacterium]|nr:hypothetical protein FACS189490_04780 [Clostridia bacterium]
MKKLSSDIAAITPDDIAKANKALDWYTVELTDATATPYVNRGGYGISYSVKADEAHIVLANAPKPVITKASGVTNSVFPKPPAK